MTKILSNKSNIDLDYPICRPSLDLDFTQEVLDPRITFSRGSIGTRVNRNRLIETVSANQPRFDYDPVTGECKGLLIEESRTNIVTNNNDFNNIGPSGSRNGSSIISNSTTSPDGSNTASTLIEGTNNGTHAVQIVYTFQTGNKYCYSIFAKAYGSGNRKLLILFGAGAFPSQQNAIFDLVNGTITNVNTVNGSDAKIEKYPNGWYKCTLIGATTTSTSVSAALLYLVNESISASYTGDGTSGIYLWGAQLEQGAFPTSYIPTTASTVTRSADLASMTGTNFSSWYNQSGGTVYSDTRVNGVQTGRYDRLWAITNSNLNLEGISLFVTGPAGLVGAYASSITITNSATEQIGGALVESAITTPKLKSAFAFKTNDCASAYNGNLRLVDKSAILLSNPDRLLMGQPQRFQGTSCMTISRLTYYPRALKQNQLQTLTS